MNQFLAYLQTAGPFTTPLCVAMAFAIWYLVRALEAMERRAGVAEKDAIQLRERRADDLKEGAEALAEFGEAMGERLREHDAHIERVLDRVQRRDLR